MGRASAAIAAILVGVLSSAPARAQATIEELLVREAEANSMCRGGPGDAPITQAACILRSRLVDEIRRRGWCYGPFSAPMSQQHWAPCAIFRPEDRG